MANALVDNVARFPATTIAFFKASPTKLRDESTETLVKIARIWAREGYHSDVLEMAQSFGANSSVRAALQRVCSNARRPSNVH